MGKLFKISILLAAYVKKQPRGVTYRDASENNESQLLFR